MSAHTCHAFGCNRHCPPEYLMCAPHWRMVPKRLQAPVYAHYQEGQCNFSPRPTEAWHKAASHAIAYVAVKEGWWTVTQANTRLGSYGPRVWVSGPGGARGCLDFLPTQQVYIGREMPGQEGSVLGNPFSGNREEAIAQYRGWLQEHAQADDPVYVELRRILQLSMSTGVVLRCWCIPQPCHGDVIVDALQAMWVAGWRS